MIFTIQQAQQQLSSLLIKYPDLIITEMNDSFICLCGKILVHRIIHEFSLHQIYDIEIHIPLNSDELPYIIDKSNYIDSNYHHSYSSGKLCLETDSRMLIRFINGFNLIEWMDEFVEPYFVSYEYFRLYGEFPNGERQHGIIGVIESYQDLLHTDTLATTYNVMTHIRDNSYRGHQLCPCGSSAKLRNCHGKWMLPFYNDNRIKEIMLKDLQELEAQLYEAKQHQTKTN